jgi:hypothetical protein
MLYLFRFLITNIEITIPKMSLFFYLSSLSISILSLFFDISFIHLISLPSLFTISPRSFLSLSHVATSIPPVLNCLFLLIAHSAPSFLSSHSILLFYLRVLTSKSRHNLSFFGNLSPQVLRNFLCHTPLILPIVPGFFDSFPSLSFSLRSTNNLFLLILIFPLLHWRTLFSDSISFSPSPFSFSFFFSNI